MAFRKVPGGLRGTGGGSVANADAEEPAIPTTNPTAVQATQPRALRFPTSYVSTREITEFVQRLCHGGLIESAEHTAPFVYQAFTKNRQLVRNGSKGEEFVRIADWKAVVAFSGHVGGEAGEGEGGGEDEVGSNEVGESLQDMDVYFEACNTRQFSRDSINTLLDLAGEMGCKKAFVVIKQDADNRDMLVQGLRQLSFQLVHPSIKHLANHTILGLEL